MQVDVFVPLGINKAFAYDAPENIQIGQIVEVPFRNHKYYGVVWGLSHAKIETEIKSICHVTPFQISEGMRRFVQWVATYTMAPLPMILKMMIPVKSFETVHDLAPTCFKLKPWSLSDTQQKAYVDITTHWQTKPIVLDGVTGSGKTEVYLALVRDVLAQGKQCLILLPEIALTHQITARIAHYFGIKPDVWHSQMTAAQRNRIWQNVNQSEPLIVIGARSALFLPFANLGLIVVDEEHDSSYKQEDTVVYHARDMAVVRANLSKIPIILSSATPSLETLLNVKNGKYHKTTLEHRYGGSQIPSIQCVDLKGSEGLISDPLQKAIQHNLDHQQQVLLFMNRRGYAPILLCKKCGFKLTCQNCCTHLVYHKSLQKLICHHCGFVKTSVPENCSSCQKTKLTAWGPGVEKVEETVHQMFPKARTLVLASDHMDTAKKLQEAMTRIHAQEVDIIIGTQVLAKGHHFPQLTLVGVIDAGLDLNGIDLRSAEKTYQLLHQVAGRCGRETMPGKVILQTFDLGHPVIDAMRQWDRDTFVETELQDRQLHNMPPYAALAAIILSASHEATLQSYAKALYIARSKMKGVDVFGPIPAPLAYLRKRHRYRFLIKCTQPGLFLQEYLQQWVHKIHKPSTIKMTIDINPQSFF